MEDKDKLVVLKARLRNIIARGKTEDFPGVRRKLERQIRVLEAKK